MQIITQSFTVPFEYKTYFTQGIFQQTNSLLHEVLTSQAHEGRKKVFIVLDSGVAQANRALIPQIQAYFAHYSESLDLRGEVMVVEGGESAKNNEQYVQDILRAVSEYAICRHSYLIAIGGGAVLDMAGFAAAIAHRSVRHIRIPTTVLSQNDSGVGVKNGVNAFGKKNFTGTFKPPQAVINDSDFLLTLGERDWRSGISEAIKVALIKDAHFFEEIEAAAPLLCARDMPSMEKLIYKCADMHIAHIASRDPFEMGSSRPLDFGHWSAHKLEYLTHYALRHGEAVAIGIALDSTYSYLQKMLSAGEWERIISLIKNLGFAIYHEALLTTQSGDYQVIKGLEEFREHLGGELTIMLLTQIGKGKEVNQIDKKIMLQAAELLSHL
jgi:3-dehydroquinate synthase